ncbi:MAG: ubiquinol-cytochrome C chaperone [Methylobacteriaceae bacterium]|nr:ubiquinol-cytochrome C chaperone [Methylobacteriaceae bacterium]
MFRFLERRRNRDVVEALYAAVMAAARRPALYLRLAVPDTQDGRFEMLILHAGPVLRRLEALGRAGESAAGDLGRDLADAIFRHLDHVLREQGVGDLAVPKRMKRLAEGFYGRLAAYEAAGADEEALRRALARNALGDETRSAAAAGLARHLLALRAAMAEAPLAAFIAAAPPFPAVEGDDPP